MTNGQLETVAASGTLVIAIGNPLRGDDGVGWYVAELLEQGELRPDTEVLTCHQLLPEMAEVASRSAQVIFVDASIAHCPGEVSVSELKPAPLSVSNGTHDLNPPRLLALSGRLFGRVPPATLVAIGGQTFHHSETVSNAVLAAIPTAVSRICALLKSYNDLTPANGLQPIVD